MLVDVNARHANRPIVLEPKVFFGQLQHIFVVSLKASPMLGLQQQTTLILAAIRTCLDPRTKGGGGVYYYSREGSLEVVDITCVQCLVGRVKDGSEWAILDRSNISTRPEFVAEGD